MHVRRGGSFLDSLAQDLKYGVRTMGRNKGYTAVAMLTLTLGLGGAITAFVIGDRVLLRPLPYPGADRLVSVIQSEGLSGGLPVNVRHFAALRIAARSFASLDAVITAERNLQVGDAILPVQTASVSGGFFNTVGVGAVLGRTIAPTDAVRAAPPVAVLSQSLWRRMFAADPSLVDRSITLSNVPYTVIGIMPGSLGIPGQTDVWLPCTWCERPPAGAMTTAEVVGRLDRASIDEARAELAVLWQRLHEQAPPRVRETMCRAAAGNSGGKRGEEDPVAGRRDGNPAVDQLRQPRECDDGEKRHPSTRACTAFPLARRDVASSSSSPSRACWSRSRQALRASAIRPHFSASSRVLGRHTSLACRSWPSTPALLSSRPRSRLPWRF